MSIDRWLSLANGAYLLCVIFAALFSVVLWRLSVISTTQANADIAVANSRAEQARAEASHANERASALEVKAAELGKQAAEARREQERIKAQVAWRSLTPEQGDALARELNKGTGTVTLSYTANDPEALSLAIQISRAFQQSSPMPPLPPLWKLAVEPRIDTERIFFGIIIPPLKQPATDYVRSAFSSAHIDFTTEQVPPQVFAAGNMVSTGGPVQTDAQIMIGSKRPPF